MGIAKGMGGAKVSAQGMSGAKNTGSAHGTDIAKDMGIVTVLLPQTVLPPLPHVCFYTKSPPKMSNAFLMLWYAAKTIASPC